MSDTRVALQVGGKAAAPGGVRRKLTEGIMHDADGMRAGQVGVYPTDAQAMVADAVLGGAGAVAVHGGFAAGKTYALAFAAAELVRSGVPAEEILFAVPRRSQAAYAQRVLAELGVDDISPQSVLEVACDVLDTEQARAFTGRRPRIVLDFEQAALEEDLKTLGTQPRRLRELSKFLFRGLVDLEDRDPNWLITVEEMDTLALVRASMSEQGAMLACEAANLACGYLESEPGAQAPRKRYVLADGYSSMTKASQRLLDLLANDCLVASGSVDDPGAGNERHPFSQGLDGLVDRRGGEVVVFDLGDVPASTPRLANVVWPTPADEISGVAAWIEARVKEGMLPADCAVVVPNQVWGRRLVRALEERGMACSRVAVGEPFRGDPRNANRNAAQKELCLKEIAVDKTDMLAWRCWCGFDNALLGSQAWKELRSWVAERGCVLAEALLGLADLREASGELPFPAAAHLAACVRSGLEGAKAFEGSASSGEVAREREQALDPALGHVLGSGVIVATEELLNGTHVDNVVSCGLVDGFFPGHDCFNDRLPPDIKARNLDHGRVVFDRILHLGTKTCVLSRFDHEWLVDAEPARMEIKRITARPQGRLAAIWPSAYVRERAEELPATHEGRIVL